MKNIDRNTLREGMSVEGLFLIAEGFATLAEGLTELAESFTIELESEKEVEIEEPTVEVEEEVQIEEEIVSDEVELSREHLEGLSYRELQKVAKELDILATGKTEDILSRILEEPVVEVIESMEEVLEDEVLEELIEEISEEEVEEVEDTMSDKVDRALKDYSEEDLADVLVSVGKSPKGKRQALIAKIVKAIDEGLLELDLDEVEEEIEVEEEKIVEDRFEDMTEARRTTIPNVIKELDRLIETEEITENDLDTVLEGVYTRADGYTKKLPLKEKIEMFKEVYVNLIDDEGEQHELGEPYLKNGIPSCCSKELVELNNGNVHCEVCSQEYELS